MTVITDWFESKSRTEAEIFGVPDLPMVVLKHPVGQLPIDEMRRITESVFAQVERAICTGGA